MTTDDPRKFHLVMSGVLIATVVLENTAGEVLPTWNPPEVGLLTLAVTAVWLGRYVMWHGERSDARHRLLQNRVERLEQRNEVLEQEILSRRSPYRPGGERR